MKHIMITNHDAQMFRAAEHALQEYYSISPLPKDIDLQDYLRHNPVDLFLLTVTAAHTDSFHMYDNIMRIPEMIGKPVIFFAEQVSPELEQQALSIGAHDFISMSVSPELLLHRICTCLELMELRKQKPYVEKYQDAISFSFAELVEFRDVTTGGHLKNTQRYFEILLKQAMASDLYKDIIPLEDTRDLLRSVTLHDIGKIGINDEVLRKSSALDFKEFEYMKTHTILGKQAFDKIIKETGGNRWLYLARDMAYSHHERWDGTGYPDGLSGQDIPLFARMLTIADVYDALTSARTYKEAYSHQKAMEIILEGKGSFFDPDLVDLFINANEQFEEALNKKQERE
ncbi:MAG TPA: HD domain-containing phosphohydrolase [Mobilitalea sp.]|nr:HD domain-containing phosphohydrolase [Mobilitalea sp.]